MQARTTRTKTISVRVPEDYLLVVDALVEAGFFSNRTELVITALKELIEKFAPPIRAYIKTKEELGTPLTPADFEKFFVEFRNKTKTIMSSLGREEAIGLFNFVIAAKLLELDHKSPSVLEKLVRTLDIFISKENSTTNRQTKIGTNSAALPERCV